MANSFCYLVFFFAILLIDSCKNNTINKTSQKEVNDNFIDSLKLKSNKAEILLYVDLLKSKMELSSLAFINSKPGLDSIFRFVGSNQNDSCFLNLNTIPDGEIRFYKDNNLITNMQFVLAKSCKGFYSDFTKSTKKYKLTTFGDTVLSNLKRKAFNDKRTTTNIQLNKKHT
jgi:hypothetical protein